MLCILGVIHRGVLGRGVVELILPIGVRGVDGVHGVGARVRGVHAQARASLPSALVRPGSVELVPSLSTVLKFYIIVKTPEVIKLAW